MNAVARWLRRGCHRANWFSVRVVDLQPSYRQHADLPSLLTTWVPIDRWRRLAGVANPTVEINELFALRARIWDATGVVA